MSHAANFDPREYSLVINTRPLLANKAIKSNLIRWTETLTVPTLDRTAPLDIIAEAPMKTFVTSCQFHATGGCHGRSLVSTLLPLPQARFYRTDRSLAIRQLK